MLRHNHTPTRRAHIRLDTGKLTRLEAIIGIGKVDHDSERSRPVRKFGASIVVDAFKRVYLAVTAAQGDVAQQLAIFVAWHALLDIAHILRHRDRHIDRDRIDVDNLRQLREGGADTHKVADVGLRSLHKSVNRGVDAAVAHLEPCIAQRLLGRANIGLCGAILSRILVELRLADSIYLYKGNGPFVVVFGLYSLRSSRLERSLRREQRRPQQSIINHKEQVASLDGHTRPEVAREEIPTHSGLNQGFVLARDLADKTTAIGDNYRSGIDNLDRNGRHHTLRSGGFSTGTHR